MRCVVGSFAGIECIDLEGMSQQHPKRQVERWVMGWLLDMLPGLSLLVAVLIVLV